MNETHLRYRRIKNGLASLLALTAVGMSLAILLIIIYEIVAEGAPALSRDVFLKTTPPPGAQGGLANSIVGSLMMVALAMAIAIPFGLMGGAFLAEYQRRSRWGSLIRFCNDTLLATPSICVGIFVYALLVKPMHGFSGYAGAVALALIAVPVILRTTESFLLLVPDDLREAAAALGATTGQIAFAISFRAARSGILTGILIALSRIMGETAPLLFTALNNQFWNMNLAHPMANLPSTIYQLAMSPYDDWHRLAWAGALLITVFVLGINILSRYISSRSLRSGRLS